MAGESPARYLKGEIWAFEMASFSAAREDVVSGKTPPIFDAARTRMTFTQIGADGNETLRFAVVASAKIRRDEAAPIDVIAKLGEAVGAKIDACLRAKNCPAVSSAVTDLHREASDLNWRSLEEGK
jgi:hypothetical protein